LLEADQLLKFTPSKVRKISQLKLRR